MLVHILFYMSTLTLVQRVVVPSAQCRETALNFCVFFFGTAARDERRVGVERVCLCVVVVGLACLCCPARALRLQFTTYPTRQTSVEDRSIDCMPCFIVTTLTTQLQTLPSHPVVSAQVTTTEQRVGHLDSVLLPSSKGFKVWH